MASRFAFYRDVIPYSPIAIRLEVSSETCTIHGRCRCNVSARHDRASPIRSFEAYVNSAGTLNATG
jgi:hypothetical protein